MLVRSCVRLVALPFRSEAERVVATTEWVECIRESFIWCVSFFMAKLKVVVKALVECARSWAEDLVNQALFLLSVAYEWLRPSVAQRRQERYFQGRRCCVTGGASGIGLALVRRLLDLKAHVFVIDVNSGAVRELQ